MTSTERAFFENIRDAIRIFREHLKSQETYDRLPDVKGILARIRSLPCLFGKHNIYVYRDWVWRPYIHDPEDMRRKLTACLRCPKVWSE